MGVLPILAPIVMPESVRRRLELPSSWLPLPLCVWLGLAVLVLLASPGVSLAQGDPAAAEQLAALRLDWLTQLARREAASAEAELIAPPRESGRSVGNFQDPTVVLRELGPALSRDYQAVRNRLIALGAKASLKRETVQTHWADVYRQRVAFRQYAEQRQAILGFGFESDSPVGFQPTLVDGLLLAWAGGVGLLCWRLRLRERRREIRRAARAAAAGLLAMVCGLSGCGGPQRVDAQPWVHREQAELTTAVQEATASATTAITLANQKWQAAVEPWAKMVAVRGGTVEADLRQGETELRDRLRAVLTETRLAIRLAEDADDQLARLAEETARLDRLEASAKWRSIGVASLRSIVALGLLAGTIAPYWLAQREQRAARQLAARTCPRCFRLDTLEVERIGPRRNPTAEASAHRRKKPAPPPPEADDPHEPEAICSRCGLRIRMSYLTVPRLCFPAVGVRSSGKTHMLATAYDRIRRRTAPTVATLQPARSTHEGEAERRFEQFIHLIVNLRGEAGATDRTLPNPILIHVMDADPIGPNSTLVNLFDYSGELVNRDVDVNQLKATAVRMDGFLLFLDPTQLYGDNAKVTLEEQLGMLDEFLAELRQQRQVPVGQTIPVPVAVCIPKFDLLLTENPISGQSVVFIRSLLQELTPANPRTTTLALIQARSQLVEQMLPMMFPGVNIREIIEGYFGRQLMFFPISSVNLIERELGVKDLSRRSAIIPYGVAEPIVWLLHMHGYEVFATDSPASMQPNGAGGAVVAG